MNLSLGSALRFKDKLVWCAERDIKENGLSKVPKEKSKVIKQDFDVMPCYKEAHYCQQCKKIIGDFSAE